MMPMLTAMPSCDQKSHIVSQFDSLDIRNAMVPLKMLMSSDDINTNASDVT